MKRLLILSPCHKEFGGWYRANNITNYLRKIGYKVDFIYNNRYYSNILIRVLIGLKNSYYIITKKYDIVHIFELVQPETFLPALTARLLKKKVTIDIGDDWTSSPTYLRSGKLLRFIITRLDYSIKHYAFATTTSGFLQAKLAVFSGLNTFKLINGVNYNEFQPIERVAARLILGIRLKEKILLSFGNTLGGDREYLLNKVYGYVKELDPSVQLLPHIYLNKKDLALYLGASDLILFPTGDSNCEKACFPIRVGSILNAERVIATDNTDTEFKQALKPFNCMVLGDTPQQLARNIVNFLEQNNQDKWESNVREAKQALGWDKLIGGLCEFYDRM